MNSWNRTRKLCGMQIMDTYIRMVELKLEGEQLRAGQRYTTELSPGSIINGAIIDKAAVIGCIEGMITAMGMHGAQVHLIVPAANKITRSGLLETQELSRLAGIDKENVRHKRTTSHSRLSYIRLGSPLLRSQQDDVIVIATPVELIHSYKLLVEQLGLEPLTIEPSLYSLYRAIFRQWKASSAAAVTGVTQRFILLQTDIGFSEISIFNHGVPVFNFVIRGADYATIKEYTYNLQMEFMRLLSYFRQAVFLESTDLRHLYLIGEPDWLKKLMQPLDMLFEGNLTLLSLADLMNTKELKYEFSADELELRELGA